MEDEFVIFLKNFRVWRVIKILPGSFYSNLKFIDNLKLEIWYILMILFMILILLL